MRMSVIPRFSPHNHTEMSNIHLIDSINKLDNLVAAGLAITDHETIANSIRICKLQDNYPDFKIAIGNEIYLTTTRDKGQKYFHFILIAKDAIGHRQLRELSSIAWLNSYTDKRLRIPTLKAELTDTVMANPGHLIATSACIGGELSYNILKLLEARRIGDQNLEVNSYNNILHFMDFCTELFKDDFYVEIAPGASAEQVAANKMLVNIAKQYGCKVVIGDDSHYLKKEDRYVHKAYLNSADGEREVDSFYQYAYLHDEGECLSDLYPSFENNTKWYYEEFCHNSMEMMDKIEIYDLRHNQTIPSVEVKEYPKKKYDGRIKLPVLQAMLESDDKYDRYWVNQCLDKLKEKDLYKEEYLKELEVEADTKKTIGEKLGTNLFKYPIVLQHYIDMMWDCGSLVGAGRGSSCAGLNHYLLGVTQLDPIKWNLPFFRYINKERIELPSLQLILGSCK